MLESLVFSYAHLKIFSLVSLLFLASSARVIPTHLFKFLIFKYSNLFAFYSILAKVIAFQDQNIT